MSVKLLEQLYANLKRPLRAERVTLPLQTIVYAAWKVCVKLGDQLYAGLRQLQSCVNLTFHAVTELTIGNYNC